MERTNLSECEIVNNLRQVFTGALAAGQFNVAAEVTAFMNDIRTDTKGSVGFGHED
jgi:hypothetical protein